MTIDCGFLCPTMAVLAMCCTLASAAEVKRAEPGPLDPRGRIHMPIGLANDLDHLKTFVEAEGPFSPGFATYGIYVWVYDPVARKLTAPTMEGIASQRGLPPTGHLIPWTEWSVGDLRVRTEICQVRRPSAAGNLTVVGARVHLTHSGTTSRKLALYVALRPLGPAGGPVGALAVAGEGAALLVDGHTALVAETMPSAAGVVAADTIGDLAMHGQMPADQRAESATGDCSGALRFDLEVAADGTKTLGFICPVLAGRRAVGHQWDGTTRWAQFDLAKPNPPEGGVLQPDAGVAHYRAMPVADLFSEAKAYWHDLIGRVGIRVPDSRWGQAFAAVAGHAALTMNEGAPDVAVINYNVFNRDGVYVANILQKMGRYDLASAAIDYFLQHPFNGRVGVEADNPGQVLWIMGQHWLMTRDPEWLQRILPAAMKLAAMVRYYRTTPPPHHVKANSLEFGDTLPPDQPGELPAMKRQILRPGACDGHHPEYTEAFDIAGLRAAALLAEAGGQAGDAETWARLAETLLASYTRQFGEKLGKGYGSYGVLWPCRLYPLHAGPAFDEFRGIGARSGKGWWYFPLATAHQGLLAGNRESGHETITRHLDHDQMRGWYVFDEGGRSGSGGWHHSRTTWNPSVAMPHGWAIAELWLLLRDSLVFEDDGHLVLFAGIPEEWFQHREPILLRDLPTWYGPISIEYTYAERRGHLRLKGSALAKGVMLAAPASRGIKVSVAGAVVPEIQGRAMLPAGAVEATLTFGAE